MTQFDPKRFGLITGSTCSVMFPKKSAKVGQETYGKKLATQKYFKYYDEASSWQTEHGNDHEHEAFEHYQSQYHASITKGMFMCQGDWGGTCDALHNDYGLDFKCPTSLQGFLDYLHDGIDEQQYHQAQMYMFLFDKSLWKVCIYLTETQRMTEMGNTYPVPHDKRMIIIDVPKDPEWSVRLKSETPNIVSIREKYYNALVSRFG